MKDKMEIKNKTWILALRLFFLFRKKGLFLYLSKAL